jgi:hypothetical protein
MSTAHETATEADAEDDWENEEFVIPQRDPQQALSTPKTEEDWLEDRPDDETIAKQLSQPKTMHDTYATQKKPRCAECTRPLVTDEQRKNKRCDKCVNK